MNACATKRAWRRSLFDCVSVGKRGALCLRVMRYVAAIAFDAGRC